MLFRRRKKPTRIEQLRVAVWPRHSWVRSTRYYSKRVLRLTATPHAIALGFAAGAFASFTPLIGFHFLIAFAVAYVVRGNLIASALGTSIGNPLTFPFIWATTFKIGSWILPGRQGSPGDHEIHRQFQEKLLSNSIDVLLPMLKPMLVGAIPLGLVTGTVCYFVVYKSVELYQTRRRKVIADRRGLFSLKRAGENDPED